MGGYDYVEAFDRLLRLNLKARQEREIVHVLAVCCRDCKTYNPFFALLGNKLCEFRPSFKFTFQLHFWDAFKMLQDMQANNIRNLARLCADLVTRFSLSLSIFKVRMNTL
jgi:nucleolar MIF4G domain-containing protein 1